MKPLVGLAALARIAFAGADLNPVKKQLLERLQKDENDANALLDLSTVSQLMGQRQLGLSLQAFALGLRQVFRAPGALDSAGVRLLAILAPGDLAENNAVEFLVEGSDIRLDLLYVGPDLPLPPALPDHDLAMVAVCETDRRRPLLRHIDGLLKAWPRPVICAPRRIARLSRDGACALLQSLPGVVMPVTARFGRPALPRAASLFKQGGFPIIARPVDSQKGHGLKKLDDPIAVLDYLKTRPEADFYAAPYVDYRGSDGLFRKYRIVLIDGKPYACHMAISDHWIVHYVTAGMLESPGKRAEEARFFAGFDEDFGCRHREALRAIAGRLGLEYVGIDCAETPDGKLLVFEVDSGMTVHAMDPVDVFPYKRPQMANVFRAFRQMLVDTVAARRLADPPGQAECRGRGQPADHHGLQPAAQWRNSRQATFHVAEQEQGGQSHSH